MGKESGKIIEKENRLPIIVGGTNLYLESLIYNYELPVGKDDKIRLELEKQFEDEGLPSIIQKIKKIDPEIETKIDIYNPRRVMRAAEICLQTGSPLERNKGELQYNVLQVGITIDREELYKKINRRVEEMMKEGLLEEVRELKKKYTNRIQAMTGIGYRQMCMYISKEISLKEAVGLIKRDTRRYAKRQMTWLKRDKTIEWIKNYQEAEEIVKKFV